MHELVGASLSVAAAQRAKVRRRGSRNRIERKSEHDDDTVAAAVATASRRGCE